MHLVQLPLVHGNPINYNTRYEGCQAPDKAYGPHEGPEQDDMVLVALNSASGDSVGSWEAGLQYSFKTEAYTSSEVHVWVHASDGARCFVDKHLLAIACISDTVRLVQSAAHNTSCVHVHIARVA